MKRTANIKRVTKETNIEATLCIDGQGNTKLDTPFGFLTHMLELFGNHGQFDISLTAKGDISVDEHHIVEDTAIVLAQAFANALSEKRGINRYGFFILPMDEAVATVAIDFSGRYSFKFDCLFNREKVGDVPTELIKHFWDSFAQNAKINLFIKVENGENEHHKVEAIFKATARALRMACEFDEKRKDIPSTKGTL